MPLFRDIECERWMMALQAFSAHVPATLSRCPAAGHRQTIQRGNGATTDQDASATLDWKVDQFHQPAYRAVFHINRRMISPGGTRIHHGSEKVCQHADGCACRVDPGGETRMLVAHGMRENMLLEEVEERFGRSTMLRQLLIEQQLAFRGRHRAIDRLFRNALKILGCYLYCQHAQMVKGLSVHLQRRWVARGRQCTR